MPRTKAMPWRAPFSLNLTAEQLKTLQEEAERLDRPVAYLIRQAVDQLCAQIRAKHPTPAHSRPS